MVKDHSDSERGNPFLLLYGLIFPTSKNGSFTYTIPQTGKHKSRLLTSSAALVGKRISSRGIDPMTHRTMSGHSTTELHLAPCIVLKKTAYVFLEREREMFYLTTHSTHFIYGYMASDIWLRTILIVRKETRCRHIDYSYRLAARVLLYAPSHRQDSTYHGLCYTSRGALAGTRNSSMGRFLGFCF